ncbi:hypothetical protein SAMN05216275_14123 [Streptosporangium canum]|uniref:Uncharacterized protein n=1 Tax=Streptosporangium canum TaxID=324952 RepID=A0A1I4DEE1_9ACTN|nr:hypothetical protein [Streptosporangium canum]SFK91842.1 hypothetical protein SAMN05216275_14123 [Streptosporangium canum]
MRNRLPLAAAAATGFFPGIAIHQLIAGSRTAGGLLIVSAVLAALWWSAERRAATRRPDRVDQLIEQALAETRDQQWLRDGRRP